MNLEEALEFATKKFQEVKIETANLDALLLLRFILKKPKEFLLAHPEIELSKNQKDKFVALVKLRATRYPIAYILGYKEFYGREFQVNQDVLIPRPETEKIIDLAIKYIKDEILTSSHKNYGRTQDDNSVSILDIGTGSGCIAITLDLELTKRKIKYQIIASDISDKALKNAKINSKKLHARNVSFIKSNLFKNIEDKFDLIVTNLPYVEKLEIKNELAYEPNLALVDKKQILQMLKEYKKYLKPNGILIYETTNGKVKKMRLPRHSAS